MSGIKNHLWVFFTTVCGPAQLDLLYLHLLASWAYWDHIAATLHAVMSQILNGAVRRPYKAYFARTEEARTACVFADSESPTPPQLVLLVRAISNRFTEPFTSQKKMHIKSWFPAICSASFHFHWSHPLNKQTTNAIPFIKKRKQYQNFRILFLLCHT